jgi:glycosyltransferase involved in cell wall biosynthesis
MNNKISVVIPAYNEGEYIKDLINTILKSSIVDELILVDDCSKPEFAQMYDTISGIKVVHKPKNGGKDAALLTGIELARNESILILDADLQNIKTEQIDALEKYVGNKDIVSIARGGDYGWAKAIGNTYLTMGEHLLTKSLINKYKQRLFDGVIWSFDNELNKISLEIPADRLKYVEFKDVTHILKGSKLGFVQGVKDDIKMIYYVHIKRYHIYKAIILLRKLSPFIKGREII